MTAAAGRPTIAEVEIRNLALDYEHLRVRDTAAEARLSASIERDGQLHPMWVVARDTGSWVLVDGYRRVRALRRLGRDTARVLEVGTCERESLAYVHRLSAGGRRTALEEGWLVRELCRGGWSLDQIAVSLGRSRSWVSRRLGLADGLPAAITDMVRRGAICPHGAMRALLPLARANAEDAAKIVKGLKATRVTSRDLAVLWAAYKRGDAEQRSRIASNPALFVRTHEHVSPSSSEANVLATLQRAETALCRGLADLLAAHGRSDPCVTSPRIGHAIARARDACAALSALQSKETRDVDQS